MGYSEAAWERAMKIQEVIMRKACFGEMLHIDGSKHAWLAGAVSRREADRDLGRGRRDLTALLHAQLWPAESTRPCWWRTVTSWTRTVSRPASTRTVRGGPSRR